MLSSIFDIHIPANDHKASQTAYSHEFSGDQHWVQMEIIEPIQNSASCSNMKIVASEYWFVLTLGDSEGMWSVSVLIRLSIEDPYYNDWIPSIFIPKGIDWNNHVALYYENVTFQEILYENRHLYHKC